MQLSLQKLASLYIYYFYELHWVGYAFGYCILTQILWLYVCNTCDHYAFLTWSIVRLCTLCVLKVMHTLICPGCTYEEDVSLVLCVGDCVLGGPAAGRLDLGQGLWQGFRDTSTSHVWRKSNFWVNFSSMEICFSTCDSLGLTFFFYFINIFVAANNDEQTLFNLISLLSRHYDEKINQPTPSTWGRSPMWS